MTSSRCPAALLILGLSPVLLGVDGCEAVDSVIARDDNPGVYKGEIDPLTEASSDERAKTLSERLQLIQAR